MRVCLAAVESLRHLHPTAFCFSLSSAELILVVELVLLNCQAEDGSDSCVKSLRSCLHAVEQSGVVDFEIGGHDFERPAEVFAGEADDKLLDTNKDNFKCRSDTFVVLFHNRISTPGSTFSQRKAVQCVGKPMQCS